MILVLGGTSDSLIICRRLNEIGKFYKVSVTTAYGATLALQYTSQVLTGTLDLETMVQLIFNEQVEVIIDATHPYAVEVSKTAIKASEITGIQYIRYERASLLDQVSYKKLYKVQSLSEACQVAAKLGNRIFLSTGSKNLEAYWQALGNKTLIVRVLPTSEVLKTCEKIGFQVGQIIGMKGPFTKELNAAMYEAYEIDLVITKESGQEGGFLEKIEACKKLDINVIVIERTALNYPMVFHDIEDIFKGQELRDNEKSTISY